MVAAISDAYASCEEYRARVDQSDATGDDVLLSQLSAVTQYLKGRLGRFFTRDAAVVVRTFDGNGLIRLYVPDIATATGLIVKVDLDGDFDFDNADETLTLNTHFWVGPANADKGPEVWPFQYLEIIPGNGRLGVWPEQARAVQVTASFGWPAVPGAIKEATISVTRQLRDIQGSGFTLTLQSIETAVNVSPQMSALLFDMERQYAKQTWFV
jgi:hypothetical protein